MLFGKGVNFAVTVTFNFWLIKDGRGRNWLILREVIIGQPLTDAIFTSARNIFFFWRLLEVHSLKKNMSFISSDNISSPESISAPSAEVRFVVPRNSTASWGGGALPAVFLRLSVLWWGKHC